MARSQAPLTVSFAGKAYTFDLPEGCSLADLGHSIADSLQLDYETIKLLAGHGPPLRPSASPELSLDQTGKLSQLA